jgi:uncharacterized RDD family membrane protein YckC
MQSPTNVVGKRVAAFIIDGVITFGISAIAWFALSTSIPGKCPSSGGGFTIGNNCRGFLVGQEGKQTTWYVISFAASLLLLVVLPGIKGYTPGKALLGIKLVNAEGRPPGVLRAFLRYILWIVDDFPYFIPFLTGFITALNSQRNQRVGDMAAGTFVIDKNASTVPVPGQAAAQFAPTTGWSAPPPSGPPVQPPPPQQPPPQQPPAQSQPADWYPDPQGKARLRYWDGQRWTDHTSN